MILSLVVYTSTALLMAGLGWHVSKREQRLMAGGGAELPFWSWEIVMAILIYVAVSSVRWLTSWDYNMYYGYYVSMQSLGEYSRENFEPGFALITNSMAKAGFHFAFYFALWAAAQIALLYYALRHRKVLLPWLALCIFMGPYYIFWMGFVRQSVVECLFVLMVELIVRRKFWIYLLLSLLAICIHKMCVLLIPLYLVPLIRVKNPKRWMAFALIGVCFVLGSFPQWIQWIFDRLGSLADVLGYGHYYRLFMSNNLEYAFRNVMGPARLCPLLTCLLIIWYYPAIRQMFSADRYLPALFRFSVVYMAYINLLANTTQYLTRPGELMRSCFLVMACFLLHYLWKQRKWIPFAAAAFFNFYYVYYEIAKAWITPASIYTPELYHTFLF
jgi:hypothetical protein